MAEIQKGLGVTFKVGPGQKLMKDSPEGKLYVGPRKKKAAVPAAPKKDSAKPVESQAMMPRGPRLAPPVMAAPMLNPAPTVPTPVPVEPPYVPNIADPVGGDRQDWTTYYPPIMKDGGRVRGDGACRCKTKGRMV